MPALQGSEQSELPWKWAEFLDMASYDQEAEYSMTDDDDRTTSVMDPINYRSPGGVEGNAPFEVSKHKVRFLDPPTVYPAPPTHSAEYDEDYSNLKLHCN